MTKRITDRRIDRAIAAIVEVIECEDFDRLHLPLLDRACDALRDLRAGR